MARTGFSWVVAVGVLLFGFAVLWFLGDRQKQVNQEDLLRSGVQVAIQDLRLSRGSNGTKELSVKAREGFVLSRGNELEIRDVDFVFTCRDGQLVSGKAPWGRYVNNSDLFVGDLTLKWEGWQLQAVKAAYLGKTRVISFKDGLVARGRGVLMKSREGFLDLEKRELQCQGAVEIFFNG